MLLALFPGKPHFPSTTRWLDLYAGALPLVLDLVPEGLMRKGASRHTAECTDACAELQRPV